MRSLYSTAIFLYGISIWLAALFNRKARLWVEGRQGQEYLRDLKGFRGHRTFWFHCASLGEFEQGRPVIEHLKKTDPDIRILLTFFSPSGYQVRKTYEYADAVCYLPLDTRKRMRQFVDIVNPDLVVFVKYEYWFNLIRILSDRQIHMVVISAIFRPGQHFFQWYGTWFSHQLRRIGHFFVQDAQSKELLASVGIQPVVISGDTRFDRVAVLREENRSFPVIEQFCAGQPALMLGSSWPAEERLVAALFRSGELSGKIIIAPHETTDSRVRQIHALFGARTCRYSQASTIDLADYDVMIIDTMGMLSGLYRYASVAIIGGGFGKGIHNILEAATYGCPVLFGPVHYKFKEACDLIERGGAFCFRNVEELRQALGLLNDPVRRQACGSVAGAYVKEMEGATQNMASFIFNPQSYHTTSS